MDKKKDIKLKRWHHQTINSGPQFYDLSSKKQRQHTSTEQKSFRKSSIYMDIPIMEEEIKGWLMINTNFELYFTFDEDLM